MVFKVISGLDLDLFDIWTESTGYNQNRIEALGINKNDAYKSFIATTENWKMFDPMQVKMQL